MNTGIYMHMQTHTHTYMHTPHFSRGDVELQDHRVAEPTFLPFPFWNSPKGASYVPRALILSADPPPK